MIVFHVFIAVVSLLFTAEVWAAPSRLKLRIGYALTVLTIASGTYLVASTRTHMLEACMMGLFYLGFVLFGLTAARRKLAAQQNER